MPALSFDTAGLSDGEVMALLGQTRGEDLPTFLNRTKGLVVLMAAVMQVKQVTRLARGILGRGVEDNNSDRWRRACAKQVSVGVKTVELRSLCCGVGATRRGGCSAFALSLISLEPSCRI